MRIPPRHCWLAYLAPWHHRAMIQYDPDPVINERIRRAVRYGQTRWAEVWLSLIMVTLGGVLLLPEPTFVGPEWRVIASCVTERTAGTISVAVGGARILALWINGRRGRETSLIRTIGCMSGFAFWLATAAGFAAAYPPLSTGIAVYGVLALAELHSSGRAASDMAAEDTFGLRKRRRAGGRLGRIL
ncbi:hypothetical protein [Methylobacterium nodulans]|uniref:Transmembrane protein n=1 Tax=Methylobacterium nodulans (strain LMG 21967 / CNCM I-2342 / ORS 2060) TaxID=460265 RepID=B8INR2_METNO|nr:hypothetical protein [Methylobacterium nodulans]ACL58428.1 hypothetical protein Mnod_3518 [Methylobacterium nodulans ORS 2060]